MGIYGIFGIILGLALIISPNIVPNIIPYFGGGKAGIHYTKNVGPTWILRIGGVATLIIGILDVLGIITIG